MAQSPHVAVIMAGGSGERFWPLSTPSKPKQLLALSDPNKSLLQEAVERAQAIGADDIYIASSASLAGAIRSAGLVSPDRVFAEPAKRNTLGGVCWATAQLLAHNIPTSSTVTFLPSDHAISPTHAFAEAARMAVMIAEQTGGLVAIGIQPLRPETGYGYIRIGERHGSGFRARQFVEKPDATRAKEFLASGDYLWNSGMFFWQIDAFLEKLAQHVPEAAAILPKLAADPEWFLELPDLSVDKALMERSDSVYVVPGRFSWDDVGTWDALDRTGDHDEQGNVIRGVTAAVDTSDCILYAEDGMTIGTVGVEGLVVVAAEGCVLVCPKSESQRVREIAQRLSKLETPK